MTDFWDDNTDNILKDFPPCLRKNIEELCLNSKTGLSSITLSDISPHPHRLTYDNGTLNNFHFILKVPFAGKRLKWEIIFDPEDFDFPPDFDFNDEQFLAYPDLDIITENIESLVHWDLRNPKALSLVLNQFLALYKKQQLDKLRLENIYSRYWEEYQRLISDINDIDQQHVEVSIEGNNVVFLVALPVDCTSLPEYIQPVLFRDSHPSSWYNPGEDFAHLKITILKLDGSRSNISLQLSPRLEQILAHYKNFHLPEFNEDTPLVDYVASVATLLENRIALVAEHYKMKKVYVLSIAAACSRNIVEYDTETFSKAVFLYHVDDYVCLVTVTFGVKFPLEKPSVMLSSAYCQEGRLCNRNLDKYPYNSTLRPEVNIEHLLEFLHDAVSRFMDHKH